MNGQLSLFWKMLAVKADIRYDNSRKRLRRKNRKEVKTKHLCTENKLQCCGIVIHTNRRKQFEKCTRQAPVASGILCRCRAGIP